MEVFDNHLNDCITPRNKENSITNMSDWNRMSIDEHNPKFDEEFKKVISGNVVPEANDSNVVDTHEIFDLYINMEDGLPRGYDGEIHHSTVKQRVINDDRKPLDIGTSNPITDTRLYEV